MPGQHSIVYRHTTLGYTDQQAGDLQGGAGEVLGNQAVLRLGSFANAAEQCEVLGGFAQALSQQQFGGDKIWVVEEKLRGFGLRY